MKKMYIIRFFQWLGIAFSIVMIIIGLIIAYLFVADILYEEEDKPFDEREEAVYEEGNR
ncbi:hypothetical protein [Halobacillus massiliensis]|uniref:hypothetical protein n=1 Tax=Halobacillus massiliensis TaxID=1926286 RepID=UPI0015C47EDE|nr:hypothetical protein [Halobacillus massiliensis]